MVVLYSHLGKREKSILGGFATVAAVGLSGVRLDCLGLASAHSNSCSASVMYNYHTYRIRKNIGEELNLAIWRTKTKSPIFDLANIFCTHLVQNFAHDLSVALVQIEQSLVKHLAPMSSASNAFKQ